MKVRACLLVCSFLMIPILVSAQRYPVISESERITRLIPPSEKVRMVMDTDAFNEIDDQFALVYALISTDDLDVEAVYAAPFLNRRSTSAGDGMEKSYEEIKRILKKLDLSSDDFAFRGSSMFIEDVSKPEASPAALDLIRRARQSDPENPLYVVSVGAITNIANAILLDSSIISNIVVVWLGGNGHSWPYQHEFNYFQDIHATRTIFDSGVPLVQLPCKPVVTHLATTLPELESNLDSNDEISGYLLSIFRAFKTDHFARSKVLWDMSAVAYVINPDWTPSDLVHSPIVNDELTLSFDDSRHFIRRAYFVNRDAIFRDFFTKLKLR